VFDFGGGTLDVSLLTLDEGTFRVKAVAGDTHLGGEDLDDILVKYITDDFKTKHGKDISEDAKSSDSKLSQRAKRALARVRTSCQRAKCTLSFSASADVEFDYDGEDYFNSISRAHFEDLCTETFQRCLEPLERVLKDTGMKKSDIDDVVLVGGSTRIPYIQDMVSKFFEGKKLSQTVNPDEAVAYGAAIQAAILKNVDGSCDDLVFVDATPMTLGTDMIIFNAPIIPKNHPIPCSESHVFTTARDNQTGVHVGVYEGESPLVFLNNTLGEFVLSGIRPAPAGVPQIEVTFSIDADGILNVSAVDKDTKNKNEITIIGKSTLSEKDIERMTEEASKFKEADEKARARKEALDNLQRSAYRARESVKKLGDKLSDEDKEKIENKVKDLLEWIDQNPRAEKEVYEAKQKEFEGGLHQYLAPIFDHK